MRNSEWICALASEALMQSSNSHKVFIDKQCEGKCTVRVLNLWHKRQIKLGKTQERKGGRKEQQSVARRQQGDMETGRQRQTQNT